MNLNWGCDELIIAEWAKCPMVHALLEKSGRSIDVDSRCVEWRESKFDRGDVEPPEIEHLVCDLNLSHLEYLPNSRM